MMIAPETLIALRRLPRAGAPRTVFAVALLLGVVSACGSDDEPAGQATAGTGASQNTGGGGAGGKSGSGEGGKSGSGEAGAGEGDSGGAPLSEAGSGGDGNGQAGMATGEGGRMATGGEGGQAGAPPALTVSVEVTPEAGGDVALGDTVVSIPAGAVSEAVTITLEVVDPSTLAPLPSGHDLIGPAIALLPHGLTFSVPVSITLGHSGGSGGELGVLRLDDEADQTWAAISEPSFTASDVTFAASTFSIVVPIEFAVPGDVIGLQQFGTTVVESVEALVFDHQDNLILFGNGALTQGGEPTYVRKLAPHTEQDWPQSWTESWFHLVLGQPNPYGSGDDEDARAVCVDDDDNVLIAGATWGVLSGTPTSGSLDAYVRKLDAATGTPLWTHQFGGTRNDRVDGVATDSEGSVLLTGMLGQQLVGHAYVRKLDSAGVFQWEYVFTPLSTTGDYGVAIGVAPSGDPIVLGWTNGDIVDTATNAGKQDYFVSKLNADTGEPIWTMQYGTAEEDCAEALAVDTNGDVLVAGQTGTCLDSAYPGLDAFVLKLDGEDGSTMWKHDLTTPGEDRARAVAVDPLGNVLVAGQSTGSFDSGKNVNQGKLDVFVRKLSPSNGAVLWTNLFGNADDQRGHSVAANSDGLVVVGGNTLGGLDNTSAGGWDAFFGWLLP